MTGNVEHSGEADLGKRARSEQYHILIWLALSLAAYATAGPYTLASCWILIPLTAFSSMLTFLALVAFGVVMIAVTVPKPPSKTTGIDWPLHGAIASVGLVACYLAAYSSAGSVSCL